ncbi:RHS repeat-associated core domain-containing protein [Butyricimonas synergistica]|uniref:RHS repeat-associated core domain-containing protein n=1 Tax=Butyricimonas synergistica TaxID=544644 RepID=UPI0022E24666|nr:RHS repeat-associated core domain-containing protein [Butyricimonas synergistica]
MINDSRRALNLSYNVLNLLSEVKTDNTVKASYGYLADGTKLRVRDAGSNGFDYVGSLTYKSGCGGLQLEAASFGDGVLLTGMGGLEVNYFLTDHLGSVRVIVDASGVVKERNDYYPFGARHVKADYPQQAVNKFKFNGKEEQVTGDLGYLDHGARMYDSGLGRWFGMDILSEYYLESSPYHFSGNNPILFIDDSGMDYWSTNDPSRIASFLWSLMNGANYFDFCGWNHATDAEFTGNLTYNDETGKFYTCYGTERDGETVIFGLSFDANILPVVESAPYQGAFVREPLSGFWQNLGYYTGIGGYDTYPGFMYDWKVSREGRLTGIKPIELVAPDIGIGKGGLLKSVRGGVKGAKSLGTAAKSFSKNVIPPGFKEVKKFGYQHGQKVYEYKGKYYSKDIDGHNGGVWKVFEAVGGKLKRIGTADETLTIFKN